MMSSFISLAINCGTRCRAQRPTTSARCIIAGSLTMHRILAIIERDLRRFRRSPTLVLISMVMPIVQLVVLGYAFGGKVKHLKLGVVDADHGVPAIKMKEMLQAVAANPRPFETFENSDETIALRT